MTTALDLPANDWQARVMVRPDYDANLFPRFFARLGDIDLDDTDSCWRWPGAVNNRGYGVFSVLDVSRLAHRVAWFLFMGPIPSGLVIDHLCMTRSCVNVSHLDLTTMAENTRRGYAPSMGAAFQLAKTHCPKGHPYDAANTYVYRRDRRAGRLERHCRACAREGWHRRKASS